MPNTTNRDKTPKKVSLEGSSIQKIEEDPLETERKNSKSSKAHITNRTKSKDSPKQINYSPKMTKVNIEEKIVFQDSPTKRRKDLQERL